MITENIYNALKLLIRNSVVNPMKTSVFAHQLWGNDPTKAYLFTAVSYSANGACSGKKAWLCAGSLLSKFSKHGWVGWTPPINGNPSGYYLTNAGHRAISEFEALHGDSLNKNTDTSNSNYSQP